MSSTNITREHAADMLGINMQKLAKLEDKHGLAHIDKNPIENGYTIDLLRDLALKEGIVLSILERFKNRYGITLLAAEKEAEDGMFRHLQDTDDGAGEKNDVYFLEPVASEDLPPQITRILATFGA